MMFRVAYRTLAGGVQSFVANWTVNVSGVNPTSAATYQAGVRFAELRRDPGTGAVSIQNQVTYAPGLRQRRDRPQPLDGLGRAGQPGQQRRRLLGVEHVARALARSGRGAWPAIPADTLNQGEATVFAGTGVQQGSSSRWGDYSALTVDPSDDCTFLYTQEYYAEQRQLRLDDARRQVQVSRVHGARRGGPCRGTVTVCGGGRRSPAPSCRRRLGYVRVTDAAGAYSMDLPPGSYTITVTKPRIRPAAARWSSPTATTTTLDACLAGVPILAGGGRDARRRRVVLRPTACSIRERR